MRKRRSREGICRNNAVQFKSCHYSSYCTTLGGNGCIDIIPSNLRDSSMVIRLCGQFTEGQSMCMTKTVVADRPW